MKQKILFLSCLIVYIFAITSCKNGTIEVTVSEGTNMAAALSPDKSTIAIALQGTIWTIPAEGGKAKSVTDEMGDSQEPDWSPNGEKIAFHSYRLTCGSISAS